jgi:adenylate cyclase, class 2
MKEVEILVNVKDKKEKVLDKLAQFDFGGVKKVLDIYFFSENHTGLMPKENHSLTECFRIRRKDKINYITHKVDKFDEKGLWLYSEEEETEFKDFDIIKKIISNLGFKQLIKIENQKYTYYTKDYEIVLEDVKNLGLFLEVERLNINDNEDILEIKKDILNFISSLGIQISE